MCMVGCGTLVGRVSRVIGLSEKSCRTDVTVRRADASSAKNRACYSGLGCSVADLNRPNHLSRPCSCCHNMTRMEHIRATQQESQAIHDGQLQVNIHI